MFHRPVNPASDVALTEVGVRSRASAEKFPGGGEGGEQRKKDQKIAKKTEK